MSFRPILRPGQGFKQFSVLRRAGGLSDSGRPVTSKLQPQGSFYGIISQAEPKEIEQWKQLGTPITHTIVQHGTKDRAHADDVLELKEPPTVRVAGRDQKTRRFIVRGEPKDPGELGHFLIYRVEERGDLQ